jgi:Zn-dependent M28 family amino/carboxypeptidase
VFFVPTGEEWGLLGARWFIKHPYRALDQYVGVLGIEIVGRPDSLSGGAGHAYLTGFERSTMGASFVAAGLPIVADQRPQIEAFQRSDNFAFALKGVVAHTITSFSLQPDYHAPNDELRVIDFSHFATVINVTARAMRMLADGPRQEWKPGGRP